MAEGASVSFEKRLGAFKEQAFPDLCLKCFLIHMREFCDDFRIAHSFILNVGSLTKMARQFRDTYLGKPRYVAEHKLHF